MSVAENKYQFEHKDMQFSKDGQLDELIVLDRYAVPTFYNYEKNDTVVAIVDNDMGTKKIGTITSINNDGTYEVTDRLGEKHTVREKLLQKPLETEPYQLWERWSKGGSSVEESPELQEWFENELRWLFDGYRYSLGGRIQLMLGQEHVTGKRANLTAYNCFSGDTIVQTKTGAEKIKNLKGWTEVLSKDGIYRRADFKSFGEQELFEVTLTNGKQIKTTAGHEWFVSYESGKPSKVTTLELEGRKIPIVTHKPKFNKNEVEKGIRHGIFYSDGTVNKNHNNNPSGHLLLFDDKKQFSEYFTDYHQVEHHESKYLGVYGISPKLKQLPNDENSNSYWYGFVLGLIATDGHVDKRGSVMYHSSNLEELQTVANSLHKTGFAYSSIKMTRELNPYNGEYAPVYKLQIVKQSVDESDLLREKHRENFKESPSPNKQYTIKVEKVKPLGVKEEVYCCEEPETHSFVIEEGYLTGNCFVIRSPYFLENSKEQFLDVVDVAFYEASIMRRGGGVGLNISTINKVKGSGANKSDFIFYLDEFHPDYEELQDRIKLGKFDGVTVVTNKEEFNNIVDEKSNDKKVNILNGIDSVDGLFGNLKNMSSSSYDKKCVAINFNNLRERNAIVEGVNGRSSGSVSWMELFVLIANLLQQKEIDNVDFAEIFSHIVHLIIQGGSRRGALMLICNDDNPQVYKFMQRKRQMGYLSGANISVGVSDEFMDRVIRGKNGDKGRGIQESVEFWDILIQSAWESAEPGIVWLERYNKESNSWYFHEIVATNPCGEQGLPPFGVCNLGHFVLSRFYNKQTRDVDWKSLERAIRIAVRLQDNIIDYTSYFLQENEETQLSERRVGIGSMGLGTLLIKLGLRYGSDEGNVFVDKLYKFIAKTAYQTSIDLAKEKGAFPKFEYDKFIQSDFMKRMLKEFPELDEGLKKYGIRNVTLLTQAPTGSTGTYVDNIPQFRQEFGGTTTGIEPYFSWNYWRAGRLGMAEQTVDLALDYMKEHGLEDVSELPSHFVTAMELEPIDHVKVQATIQKWTDSSISKTANCPRDYTVEQTDELYLQSYQLGLKGMTIYRDGSREAQVLATNEEDAKLESHIEAKKLKDLKEAENTSLETEQPILNVQETIEKRPKRLYGFTEKINFTYGDKLGKAYVTINLKDGEPWEVFVSTKTKEVSSLAKALGLMTTKLLRLGKASDNLQQAIDTLSYDQTMGTLPSAIANILRQLQKEKMELEIKQNKKEFEMAECPNCGEKAYDKGNCICMACGISKCN